MLTTSKAWQLKEAEVVVIKGDHYTLIDDPKSGPPGWTSLRTRDRAGLLVCHMIEGRDDVNVVRVQDPMRRTQQGRRRDAQRRKR